MLLVWALLLNWVSAFSKYDYNSEYTDEELLDSSFTEKHLDMLKNETRSLFKYGFDKYMTSGYPFDEVLPLDCQGNGPNKWDPDNTVRNDALGNYTVTLIDNLDTFAVMGDKAGFEAAVKLINDRYTQFNMDVNIQVFEANIRVLGGLLTAHLYASDPRKGFQIDGYDGYLLDLAYDMGKRLILAFDNNLDNEDDELDILIPFPRTNLRKGPHKVPRHLQHSQCTAGVTSLIVEFSLLSRLTNDPLFEDITRHTFERVWYTRSQLDLLPMSIHTSPFSYKDRITGVGASIDSFYEYALKYSILFDDEKYFQIWAASYKALLTHSQNRQGLFVNIDVTTGMESTGWIDALGGFFPGLQVLAGDVDNAILFHRAYFKLWNYYGAIPERWNYDPQHSNSYFEHEYREGDTVEGLTEFETDELLLRNSIALEWYPLRPEFIESTYYLYRATKDPLYLRVGEAFLERFRSEFIAPCGFSGILDIRTGTRQNRMESFALSETLKYLYLLFDEANPLNSDRGNTIFSTEGHPMWFDKQLLQYTHFKRPEMQQPKEQRFQFFTDYSQLVEDIFRKIRAKFYGHIATGWSEVIVTGPIRKYFIDNAVSNLDVGQRALIGPDMQKTLKSVDPGSPDKWTSHNYTFSKDYLGLNQCHRAKKAGTSIDRFSVSLEDDQFYQLDRVYQITLRRPPYLVESSHPELELKREFYDRDSSSLHCVARPDSSLFEAVLDTGGHVASCKIAKIHSAEESGIYIEDLDGIRAIFENSTAGALDVYGSYCEESLFDQLNTTNMLRVIKVNGYQLKQGEKLWVNSTSPSLRKNSGMNVTEEGDIYVQGVPVINMKVLDAQPLIE